MPNNTTVTSISVGRACVVALAGADARRALADTENAPLMLAYVGRPGREEIQLAYDEKSVPPAYRAVARACDTVTVTTVGTRGACDVLRRVRRTLCRTRADPIGLSVCENGILVLLPASHGKRVFRALTRAQRGKWK